MCSSDLGRSIENTSMLAKNHPFLCCPAAKHQNSASKEKPVDFIHGTARASTLAPEIILVTEVLF